MPKPIKVDEPLGTDDNGYEANRYFPNLYDSILGMMLYLESKTRPYISFSVNQCARFTHNNKASHETSVKRVFWYLQGTKYKVMIINPSNKMLIDFYVDADIVGLWVHENTQDPIYDIIRTVFVVSFSNFDILWVSKIQTQISLYNLHSGYVALYCYVRDLLLMKSVIKEVIENLVINSEKLEFVSISTLYEGNNRSIVVATSPRITPTSKHISVKYHCFRNHVVK